MVELGYELLPHPWYSPDLASDDLFLASKPEKIRRQKFELNKEVIASTDFYFEDLQRS